jgi:hypothetical protein
MNDWDKNNLDFIMSLSSKEFDAWYECLDDDDIKYAMELLAQARAEVADHLTSLKEEVVDLSQAKKVLCKYTLKGIK